MISLSVCFIACCLFEWDHSLMLKLTYTYTYFSELTVIGVSATVTNQPLFPVKPGNTFNNQNEKYFLTIKNCL